MKTSSQTNNASLYVDASFAAAGFNLSDGNNTFTATAQDTLGRLDTNAVTVKLPALVSYTYDSNGNLTGDGRRTFTYDDENQLASIVVTNTGVGTTSTKSEFVYDGLFRRRVRKEYSWVNGAWASAGETRYVYDGRLVVQERDANNIPTVSYTRGSDLSGTRDGAGGIGGLLARTDHLTLSSPHTYYHADGNGNIAALINTNQAIVARYSYDPFGNTLSKSGPLSDANAYRFSSQEYHQLSGLSLYLYRAYDPNLQRFINRDPIQEAGGIYLYAFVHNNPLRLIDPFGLNAAIDYDEFGNLYNYAEGYIETPWGERYWRPQIYYTENGSIDENKTPPDLIPGIGSCDFVLAGFAGMLRSSTFKLCPQPIQVSRWGRPGLQPGDWVMNGPMNRFNYFRSGKWESYHPWNRYAPYSSGSTYSVPGYTVKWPGGWDWFRGFYGQRRYSGPPIMPPPP